MSRIPYYMTDYRNGKRMGHGRVFDGLFYDGLTDYYNNKLMGVCAEKTAVDLNIGRKEQDDFALESYRKVKNATEKGYFQEQIVQFGGLEQDEEYLRLNTQKFRGLPTVFKQNGTITPGNASKICDGGNALILVSKKALKKYNLTPLARIIGYQDSEVAPIDFCIAPAKAMKLLLKKVGLKKKQIDAFEINEAFAVTALANMKIMGIDSKKVNIDGGSCALGHPLGFSGARLIQFLITILKRKKGKYGMAGICNGGGGATAMIIENL